MLQIFDRRFRPGSIGPVNRKAIPVLIAIAPTVQEGLQFFYFGAFTAASQRCVLFGIGSRLRRWLRAIVRDKRGVDLALRVGRHADAVALIASKPLKRASLVIFYFRI